MASLSGVLGVRVARHGSFSSRGFSFVGSPACAHCGILYSDTLYVRDVGVPRPTGLLTARVLVNGGSALPQVSTRLLLLPVLRRSYLGLRSSPLAPAHLSRAPRSGCDSPASATPRCFPISDARRVYLIDLFIARDPQYNAHTTSLFLTLSGHTFSG